MLGDEPQNALSNRYSKVRSRSHHAVVRVYDAAGNLIETHEHKGDFKSSKRGQERKTASQPSYRHRTTKENDAVTQMTNCCGNVPSTSAFHRPASLKRAIVCLAELAALLL